MPSAYLLVQAETDYVLGRYDRAISLLEALEMNPVHPRASLSRLHGAFPFKNHQHLEQLFDGLHKADVPGS